MKNWKCVGAGVCGVVALNAATCWAQGPPIGPNGPLPGYWQPGGYEARVGSPYYYSVPGQYVPVNRPPAPAAGSAAPGGPASSCPVCEPDPMGVTPPPPAPMPPADGLPAGAPATGTAPLAVDTPEGMLTVRNFPYRPLPRDPYGLHFGPGFYRAREYGHYRFPYYNYRSPWYFPGHAVYNRDTNFPW